MFLAAKAAIASAGFPRNSLTSAPATKARPAPVRMRARTALPSIVPRVPISWTTAANWERRASLSALSASGRLSARTAMSPARRMSRNDPLAGSAARSSSPRKASSYSAMERPARSA